MNNIKNEKYEIKINMNLEFVDKSKYIHQNEFNLKFIIKQSKKKSIIQILIKIFLNLQFLLIFQIIQILINVIILKKMFQMIILI